MWPGATAGVGIMARGSSSATGAAGGGASMHRAGRGHSSNACHGSWPPEHPEEAVSVGATARGQLQVGLVGAGLVGPTSAL